MITANRQWSLPAALLIVLAASGVALGQVGWSATGGPLTGPPVPDAPFAAEATTTLRQTLDDGTSIERIGTARYFRDRYGRVRVEQTISGAEENAVRITVAPDPQAGFAYALEPATGTARKGPRSIAGHAIGGGNSFAVPLGGVRFLVFHGALDTVHNPSREITREPLGHRVIDGIDTVGERLTTPIPAGRVGSHRDGPVIEERWESPELKLLLFARTSDPRVGVVEYGLKNVRRIEPPAHLFEVPADYSVRSDETWITIEWADDNAHRAAASRARRE